MSIASQLLLFNFQPKTSLKSGIISSYF